MIMRKFTLSLLLGMSLIFLSVTVWAQPGCGTTDLGTLTPTTTHQYATCTAGSSYYWDFSATAGVTYSFSTCAASEDTYIRIYNSSYTQVA